MVAALVLVTPTLVSGFALDDYVLLDQMDRPHSGEWAGTLPFDLFRWMDPGHDRALIDGAGLPWWTFDRASCAFLRPFSSLTHAVDHWLWPTDPFWMHFHSLVWFALLLLITAKAYSELIESRWVAAVAGAMFALDSAHGPAVGWISNRNALISGACGVAALLCHHRHRSGAGRRWALAAWACLGLGLTSGELGVGIVGYLLAYAMLFDRGSRRARIASILPHAAIVAAWTVGRNAGGYGSFGLGAYVDPIKEPAAFMQVLPTRSSVLLSSQLSRICSDLYGMLSPSARPVLIACALYVCGVLIWFTWPSLRARRSIRFWAGGAVLSLVPLAATLPSDRLLILVGLGVMPMLAQAMCDALGGTQDSAGSPSQGLQRACALALVLVHFVADPLMLPPLALSPALVARSAKIAEESLPADGAVREQTVIVAEVPDSASLSYLPAMRSFNGKPRPQRLYWLAATGGAARFERRSPNVLRMIAPGGFFDQRWESRSPRLPFHEGDRVELSEITVHVVALTSDGRPAVCDFVFARPLESSRYVWCTWRAGRLEPLVLPREGHGAKLSTS
jgi:hypothetical protein